MPSIMKTLFQALIFLVCCWALLLPFLERSSKKQPLKKGESEVIIDDTAKQEIEEIKEKKKVQEKPLHDVDLPDFGAIYDVREKKKQFFGYLKPYVEAENNELLALRAKLLVIDEKIGLMEPLVEDDHIFLDQLVKAYRVKGVDTPMQKARELLSRVDIVPTSLVLVQAANESAWGTSRFARIGLNFFGLWCYKKGCGMVPGGRVSGGKHEVAAFKSVERSVKRYIYNINSHTPYSVFRTIRGQLRSQGQPLAPEILATGLLPYSERGVDYVTEIIDMLRHNQRYL